MCKEDLVHLFLFSLAFSDYYWVLGRGLRPVTDCGHQFVGLFRWSQSTRGLPPSARTSAIEFTLKFSALYVNR
jgi:hypothetical protein